ncbi:MAG: carboxypeptidase regulatory-like domain-containing protein [Planctomycetes bacterium]|nr:carboxypeptidase regulatory-like domain-containing protein [Planctomycetota bacterium]MCC7171591.1 carboxypeptidase regulatory-like domain-containing protein [Planctomycetota bacterium]
MKLAHVGFVGAVVTSIGVAVVAWMWTKDPIEALEWQSSGESTSTVSATAVPVREPLRVDLALPPGEVGVEPFDDPRARAWAARDPRAILEATWVIGRVRAGASPSAEPVASTRVRAIAVDGSNTVEGEAFPEGRFALELLGRGTFELVASNARSTSIPLPIEGAQGRTIDVGVLELTPRVALFGRVVDAGGRGLPAAAVRARDVATTTDATGAFALEVGAGHVRVEAEMPGFGRGERSVNAPSTAPCVVQLAPGAEVTGVVVDAAGAAVESCEVRCFGATTRTDARGTFRFAARSEERPFVVARHAHRGAGSGVFDGVTPMRIVLDRTAAVVLLFDRALSAELREVVVERLREAAGGITSERATFGVDVVRQDASRVRVAGLAAGEDHRVRVYAADGACASAIVSIPVPVPELDLVVACAVERGGSIDVRVADEHGHAVPGAVVALAALDEASTELVAANSAATAADGCARFTDRPAHEHVVHVFANGRSEATVHVARTPVAGGPRAITVVLRASSHVIGTVPRPATEVTAPWIRASSRGATRWTRASAAGSFEFRELAAEPWEFTLWPPELPRAVAVHAGPMLPAQVLELEPGRTHELTFVEDVSRAIALRIVVVDELGRPRSAVRVSAWLDAAEVASTRSAADGGAELVLPWTARYTVRAEGDRDDDPSAILDGVTCDGRADDVLTIVVRAPR